MAIVKEMQHGECKIYFCDDYIKNDEKEIKEALEAIGKIAAMVIEPAEEATA